MNMNTSFTKTAGAVIVTRVSTGEQVKHGTSLESQAEMCRAKAFLLSLPIIAEYEDAGISGSFLLLREGMQKALADVQAGRADTLICANISRYSRDVEHQQAIRKAVRAAGGRVIFCDMEFDDTPEGDLAFSIMGGFAEYERKVIRARTMRGKRKRAEEGQQPQRSRSPYGYHVVIHADIMRGLYPPEKIGQYIIDEEKAKTARRLFAGYAAGTHSLPLLCKQLNAEGVPSPRGGMWHEPTVRVILTNPVYKGEPVSGRQKSYTDESRLQQLNALTGMPLTRPDVRRSVPEAEQVKLSAPPLVSEDIWNAVQERLVVMKARHGGNPKRMRMLSGLCFCPYCGAATRTKYQKANGKTYCYYWCGTRSKTRNFPGERPCQPDLYPIALLEQATIKAVKEALECPDAIAAALAVYRKGQRQIPEGNPRQELAALDKTLTQLKAEEAATIQAQIAGIMQGLSPEAYARAFASITARRKEAEERYRTLTISMSPIQKPDGKTNANVLVNRALEDALTALTSEDVTGPEKRLLLGTIVEKVVPHKEGADVFFAPGVFQEAEGKEGSVSEESIHTFHTTCIGMSTHR